MSFACLPSFAQQFIFGLEPMANVIAVTPAGRNPEVVGASFNFRMQMRFRR